MTKTLNKQQITHNDERLIKYKNISYYDRVVEHYIADGINVYFDYKIYEGNKDRYENVDKNKLKKVLFALKVELPNSIKKALVDYNISICIYNIEYLKTMLGHPLAEGHFDRNKKVISFGFGNLDCKKVLFHEIGHAVDYIVRKFKNSYYGEKNTNPFYSMDNFFVEEAYKSEFYLFDKYAKTNIREFVAVAFADYLNDTLNIQAKKTKDIMNIYMTALRCKYEGDTYSEYLLDSYQQELLHEMMIHDKIIV